MPDQTPTYNPISPERMLALVYWLAHLHLRMVQMHPISDLLPPNQLVTFLALAASKNQVRLDQLTNQMVADVGEEFKRMLIDPQQRDGDATAAIQEVNAVVDQWLLTVPPGLDIHAATSSPAAVAAAATGAAAAARILAGSGGGNEQNSLNEDEPTNAAASSSSSSSTSGSSSTHSNPFALQSTADRIDEMNRERRLRQRQVIGPAPAQPALPPPILPADTYPQVLAWRARLAREAFEAEDLDPSDSEHDGWWDAATV
ncbi:hypothetical protein Micbo1qcDRAFT_208061 [Microdochium bolleyi]|uniref:Uncharacterized protein n=1 Tax=Microdochium bolleyi TaxID=196109 RepID=A0A136IR68_9PEZI|nr:hypothetical protein Micbo1qcDRAFT_208061 [Microdochium bolleyi]